MGSWGRFGMACSEGSTQHDRRDASLTLSMQRTTWASAVETQLSKSSTNATRAELARHNLCGAPPLRSKWEEATTAWPGALIVSNLE